MENYKTSYFDMFNKITDIIETLKQIQIDAEEKIISEDK